MTTAVNIETEREAASGASGVRARWTAAQLAKLLEAELRGDGEIELTRLDGLSGADEHTLTFIRDGANAHRWATSRAGAALISRSALKDVPVEPGDGRALIVVDDADDAMAHLLEQIAPVQHAPSGIHPGATIDAGATLAADVCVGAGAVIGPRCAIGAGTVIHAGVILGAHVMIGAGCTLNPRAIVQDRCVIGDRVVLHPGVVLGAVGFGLRPTPAGAGMLVVPHVGHVEIGDDVEIGANSCVDRGKFGATIIGTGTKIDNLVQVGHNVRIGRNCVICGNTGIGGSATLGDGVVVGGHVGISDNVTIGEGAHIAGKSGVTCDIPAGEAWMGYPAVPVRLFWKMTALLKRMAGSKKK